jgi:hypothetical protein
MDQIQNIELQDMTTIIHGLRMSGFAFIEPDALDAVNSMIKDLPSSEALEDIYTDAREVQRLCAEVGRVMEVIDYYGTRNEEAETRYKSRTKLPPRYKNLKWEKSSKKMKFIRVAQEIPDASSEVEAIVQQSKDIHTSLSETQRNIHDFSNKVNVEIPEIMRSVPPEYQKSLLQHQAIINSATQQLTQSSQMLMDNAQAITNVAEGAKELSSQTQETYNMYSNMGSQVAASKGYLKNVVRLSKSLEGNGIISGKLLTYAKNIRDNNVQARYDAKEIEILLKSASLNREANIFIKTAGIGSKIKNMFNGGKQKVPEGYVQLDPGEQTGEQWQVGEIEEQFKNDLNWLERSWDNLVDFFGRYVRDAGTLSQEWASKNDPDKMAKIEELKTQANVMLENAKKMQGAANFTAALTGDKFSNSFGGEGTEETLDSADADTSAIVAGLRDGTLAGDDLDVAEAAILSLLRGMGVTASSSTNRMKKIATVDLSATNQLSELDAAQLKELLKVIRNKRSSALAAGKEVAIDPNGATFVLTHFQAAINSTDVATFKSELTEIETQIRAIFSATDFDE